MQDSASLTMVKIELHGLHQYNLYSPMYKLLKKIFKFNQCVGQITYLGTFISIISCTLSFTSKHLISKLQLCSTSCTDPVKCCQHILTHSTVFIFLPTGINYMYMY